MWLIATSMPSRSTIVFGIEEDDVDTYRWGFFLNLTGNFKQDTYTAGSIVGSIDRFLVVLGIRIVIGIRTAVPMGTKHYSLLAIRIVSTDDVAGLQNGTVPSFEVGILVVHFGSELFQLLGQIFTTILVGLRVRNTRTEVGLSLYISICTIGIEGRSLDDCFLFYGLCIVRFLAASASYRTG